LWFSLSGLHQKFKNPGHSIFLSFNLTKENIYCNFVRKTNKVFFVNRFYSFLVKNYLISWKFKMKREFQPPGRIKNFSIYNSYYEELLNPLHTSSTRISLLKLKHLLHRLMSALTVIYLNLHRNIVGRFAWPLINWI